MAAKSNNRGLTRSLIPYLAFIALPAILLVGLGFHSVLRQWQLLIPPAENAPGQAKEVASQIENYTMRVAQDCLDDRQAELLPKLAANLQAPEQAQPLRQALEQIAGRHSIVRYCFILRNGKVQYPLLPTPLLPARFRADSRARPGDEGSEPRTTFLDRVAMARALDVSLPRLNRDALPLGETREHAGLRQGDTFAFAFKGRNENYQAFYKVLSAEPGNQVVWGFTVDPSWLNKEALAESGAGGLFTIIPQDERNRENFTIDFPKLFPFWALVSTSPELRSNLRSNLLLVLAATVLLAPLIGVGFFWLYRAIRQEREFSRMRVDFVNSISHELKTPITLVRLYAGLLSDDPDLKPQSREYAGIIDLEAQRLESLIENVLDYSQVEKGFRKYRLKQGNLAPVIENTIKVCQTYLAARGIHLRARISQNLPEVAFDSEAVPSLVLNLVDNAVKYSGNSDTVRVDLYRDGTKVVFAVQDYGIGIAESERDKIFLAYYRAPSNEPRGGCGLGLYLVKNIMQTHGGTIELQSTLGKGSCFKLIFPVARQQSGNQVAAVAAKARTAEVA